MGGASMNIREILEDVARGRLSPEAAEKQLKDGPERERRPERDLPKFLRVDVDSAKGDKVDVRVPLKLVTAGMKVASMIPEDASNKLRERGIDLSQLGELRGDELVDALRELTVDVKSADGDIVKVYCE
jgi:hypothetical protein